MLDRVEETALEGRAEQLTRFASRLWDAGPRMPEILTTRLISGRSRIPILAFKLLAGFAGSRTPEYLNRVAEDRNVADIVRFGARRRAGWPLRGEAKARLAFLSTLSDDLSTLVEALRQAATTRKDTPDGEVVQEVLGYLLAMPPGRARKMVSRAAGELGREAAWLLRGLLHAKDRTLRLAAVQAILSVGDRGALAALDRATKRHRERSFTAEVETAKRRLQFRRVDALSRGESRQIPKLQSAYLSTIDGDGGQLAIVVRQLDGQSYRVAQVFFKDTWGVKDTFGMDAVTWEEMEGLYGTARGNRLAYVMGDDDAESVDLVDANLEAARGALSAAIEANASTSHAIPPQFEIWEPLFHDEDPPPADEPLTVPELDDAGYSGRQDLLRQSARLLDHEFFAHWFFNPAEVLLALDQMRLSTDAKPDERDVQRLVMRLVDKLPPGIARQRLRRQAWLLEQRGEKKLRDLALAAAAGLATERESDLATHPFLHAMAMTGLENMLAISPFGR